ncbi:MAG: GNAT family N-acetyltransferase [Methyloligellaceae bacterium]
MGESEQILVRVEPRIGDIDAAEWDLCANPQTSTEQSGSSYNPFVSHAFLKALEESGSVAPQAGWAPQHLVLDDGSGSILGCMPCYMKSHSQGEYVFDHGWADAFERAGGRYYPKLQVCVPFTPVTGRRLLIPPCADAPERERHLINAAATLLARHDLSSLHITFLTQGEWERLGALGLLRRTGQQFHWRNERYESFEAFLSALSSRKRKEIRKERRLALATGIEIERLTGSALTEAHWDAFFAFYMDTGSRKWGRPYLNRKFFSLVGEAMADDILLIMCRREGRYIAGALNFIGGDCLYGRYWGCIEHHRFLHFEACYYQAIEFAIERGLARVEAGAQGPHKLARGYLPVTTYSAHLIANEGLREAVAHYLEHEREDVAAENAFLAQHAPFRAKSGNSG